MLLLHLSDLHLSRYGETGSWSQRDADGDEQWETVQTWQRWTIEGMRDKRGKPEKLRLVDPEGVIHKVKGWPARRANRVVSYLLSMAMKRHETSSERLIKNRPGPEDLEAMLQVDPDNSNLRFLKVVDEVMALGPQYLLITGDITDNGFGYGMVAHSFREWVEDSRLYVVPGNHDTYDMIPRRGRRARSEAKEERYVDFSNRVGLEMNPSGAWVRRYGDLAFVGLNSCKMPRTPLSASGAVSKEQLTWLAELGRDAEFRRARLRIGLVHHHLLRMPFAVGERSPWEVAMRMRNAVQVMETATEVGLDMIFHGHRHHGYMVQLPSRPMVISAPSSTLGCKSTSQIYGWRMDLASRLPFPLAHQLIEPPRYYVDEE